ncbi:hypothetical protein NL108_007203 [Boleophthalmus pectinirostris]|uniref:uncharacterized protein LOC110171409 n=1 Tax=Boleophthalmus pectinirostris TaxID=150288 RepID=UPI000A1C1A25|nr:uncharacterized protein LOC110171409 [Boleophthalmus pectinirostris]KAJ0041764.1 hypothetical protein NL108_007203 [Boleophthalmus pectinirostris]
MEDLFWIPPCFHVIKRGDGYISGIINNENELTTLLESHSRATYTSYIKWSDHTRETCNNGRQFWQVDDYSEDVPLCVRRRIILLCQHGKAYVKKAKEECRDVEQENIKRRVRSSKKLNCPAKLFIRHITRYDTFSVKGDASRTRKEEAMRRLKLALSETHPPTSTFLHVKLPLVEAHRNHDIYPSMMISGYSGGVQSMVEVESSGEGALQMENDGCRVEGNMDIQDKKKIKLAQQTFRRELKRLTEVSYLFEDLKSLKTTSALLKNIRQSMEAQCRKENGPNKEQNGRPHDKPKTKQSKKDK